MCKEENVDLFMCLAKEKAGAIGKRGASGRDQGHTNEGERGNGQNRLKNIAQVHA